MEFRILGPVELASPGRAVDLGPAKQRCVLSVLLADVGRVVPTDTLIHRVWGETPPDEARKSLYPYLTRLRTAVRHAGGGSARILRAGGGYRLEADPQSVDLHRFRSLSARARTLGPNEDTTAAEVFGEALSLWRGRPLTGLSGEWVEAMRRRLAGERHGVVLEHNEVGLRLGRHVELLSGLREAAADHPDDERLAGQLMLALHRCGRQAEALNVFEEMRRNLAASLGVDPDVRLRELHQRILRSDVALAAPTARSVTASGPTDGGRPAELPRAVSAFVGRRQETAALDAMLQARPEEEGRPARVAPVVVVSGTAGVGKTTLVTEWAHRIRERFPDGQLWVSLHGFDRHREPVRPAHALGQLLRSLGVAPNRIPAEEEALSGLFRTLVAERRLLLVLDNAASAEQVRPLLPGSPHCAVIVTSRHRLGGLVALDGARPLVLDVMPAGEAEELLTTVLGAEQGSADAAQAAELARLCGYLPLALRVVAAQLVCHREYTVEDMVAELATEPRLDAFALDGAGQSPVRAAFNLSYASLSASARRLFRLLGLVPGPGFSLAAAVALTGLEVPDVRRLLAALADAHLVECTGSGRHHLHDLLREFARELVLAEESGTDRAAAVDRLLAWYRATAATAVGALPWAFPQLPDDLEPGTGPGDRRAEEARKALALLEDEQANLLAAIEYAAEHGPHPAAWQLTTHLARFFWACLPKATWLATASTALRAAERAGDRLGAAAMHRALGLVHWETGRLREAHAHHSSALEIHQELGPPVQEAVTLGSIALVALWQGRLDDALALFQRCLAVCRGLDRPDLLPWPFAGLGAVLLDQGRLDAARDHLWQSVRLQEQAGSVFELQPVWFLSLALWHSGQLTEAHSLTVQALERGRQFGQGTSYSPILCVMAQLENDLGRYDSGLRHAEESLSLARADGLPARQIASLNAVGALLRNHGRFEEAVRAHEEGLQLASRVGMPCLEADHLVGRSAALRHTGRVEAGLRSARQGLLLSRCHRFRLVEGQALTATAAAEADLGRYLEARHSAESALAAHRTIGHALGEARTHALLARIHTALGDGQRALAHRDLADSVRSRTGAQEHRHC